MQKERKEIINNVNQTPIEIALGIDENGMTTAKKLFDFLGMNSKNYARWYRTNITDNPFAEKSTDYFPFLTNEECGGQASFDSKITAKFAKKLSMMQKNERGEQAREYFTQIEDYAVDTTLQLRELQNNPMKLLEIHYEALKQSRNDIAEVKNDVNAVEQRVDKLESNMTITHEQIQVIKNRVNKKITVLLGGYESNAYKDKHLRGKAYSRFNKDYCDYFRINARANTLTAKFDEALGYIDMWEPDTNLRIQIKDCNAQMNMGV